MQHEDTDALMRQLDHPDPRVREQAIFTLGEQRVQVAVPRLVQILAEDTSWTRPLASHAAWALGKIGDPQAVQPLLDAVQTQLTAALDALARIQDERAFAAALEAFAQSHHPHLATLLGKRGDRRAVPVLISAMEDADGLVRFYAARALGRLGDPRAVPILTMASQHDTAPVPAGGPGIKTVAKAAARALEQILQQTTTDTDGEQR